MHRAITNDLVVRRWRRCVNSYSVKIALSQGYTVFLHSFGFDFDIVYQVDLIIRGSSIDHWFVMSLRCNIIGKHDLDVVVRRKSHCRVQKASDMAAECVPA